MYANGYYVKKDIKKSKEYFKKACDFGLAPACQEYENIIAMAK